MFFSGRQGNYIVVGRGTKCIVLNQGYITLRDPNTCLKAVNDGSF